MITIKVFSKRTGKPAQAAKVYVYWGLGNQYGKEGRTGQNGEVDLDVELPREAKVIVNGEVLYHDQLRTQMTFYID